MTSIGAGKSRTKLLAYREDKVRETNGNDDR